MYRIITIAREYGSGGRLIAQKVAEKLQMVYYDNEIIDMAAREMGMDEETIRQSSEERTSPFSYASGMRFNLSLNDHVFTMQSKIIRHLAKHDACIIVNGCADYILDDFDDVLKVFIHAPLTSRIDRVEHVYQGQHENTLKFVKKKDKQRSGYYNYYTDQKWGQLQNFDLTINSDAGIDEAAELITHMFQNGNF